MCSAPSIPAMPKPDPLPPMPEIKVPPAPEPKPLPTPQQAAPPPVMPPQTAAAPMPAAPLPPMPSSMNGSAPPPVLVNGTGADQDPIVKRLRSKRQELQQASGGTSALRIPLDGSIGPASGSTGSTGLNIPK